MDQPREIPSIIDSTTLRVQALKRKRHDRALHSLSAFQEDMKRTLAAYPSFRHRRVDMDKHLAGRTLMESQLLAQGLQPAARVSNKYNPSANSTLHLNTDSVFVNDPESPPKDSVSQPIETFDSIFYPDDPSFSLGRSNVVHVDEEYVNPRRPEKSMLEDDEFIDEPEEEKGATTPTLGPTLGISPVGMEKSVLEDDPEEEAATLTLGPTLSSKEYSSSQETTTSRCSSLPPEKNLAPSSSVLNTFFPNLSKPGLARSMKKRGYYSNDSGGQWVNWPTESELKKMPSGSRKEALIAKKLTTFINAIIQLVQERTPEVRYRIYALDSQEKIVRNRDGTYLKPDILICGTGSCFSSTSDVSDESNPEALRQWRYCIYPVEVKTAFQRTREPEQVIAQMGTYIREVFASQPNRGFVPSLIFTEETVEFMLWDRDGVLISEKMDYHKHPVSFCKLLGDLVEWNDEARGFDPYLSVRDGVWTLQPLGKEKESISLIAKYFHPYTVFGRNVICWKGLYIASHDEQFEYEEKHVLVQDAWLPEEDISFMENILTKSGLNNLPGFIQGAYIERVKKLDGQSMDSVQTNRKNAQFIKAPTLSHIRIISTCHKLCRSVDRIKHPDEPLYALKDIAEGLQYLYKEYGYVQRNIKPWTIILQPEAPEGQRGVMLGLYSLEKLFDNGAEVQSRIGEDTCINSTFFNSQNIWRWLPFTASHRHLDGVLSCYYILCFLVGNFRGPEDNTSELSLIPELLTWERGDEEEVLESKLGHFSKHKFFKAQPGWGISIDNVLFKLHQFFHKRIIDLAMPLLKAETPQEHSELMNKIIERSQPSLEKAPIEQELDAVIKCWQGVIR